MRLISIIAAASYISQFVVHAVGRPTDEDMNTMAERRLEDLIDIATSPPSSTNRW
jgi:hypothetical protein